MPLWAEDVVRTKAGTLHLPGCKHLVIADPPERLGRFALYDETRHPHIAGGLCAGCTLSTVREYLGYSPLPRPSPVCTECRGPLPLRRKGPKCARCAKREWRSRLTPEQQEAARAADRERKRKSGR